MKRGLILWITLLVYGITLGSNNAKAQEQSQQSKFRGWNGVAKLDFELPYDTILSVQGTRLQNDFPIEGLVPTEILKLHIRASYSLFRQQQWMLNIGATGSGSSAPGGDVPEFSGDLSAAGTLGPLEGRAKIELTPHGQGRNPLTFQGQIDGSVAAIKQDHFHFRCGANANAGLVNVAITPSCQLRFQNLEFLDRSNAIGFTGLLTFNIPYVFGFDGVDIRAGILISVSSAILDSNRTHIPFPLL